MDLKTKIKLDKNLIAIVAYILIMFVANKVYAQQRMKWMPPVPETIEAESEPVTVELYPKSEKYIYLVGTVYGSHICEKVSMDVTNQYLICETKDNVTKLITGEFAHTESVRYFIIKIDRKDIL